MNYNDSTRFVSLVKAAAVVPFALVVLSALAQSFTVTDLGSYISANGVIGSGAVVGYAQTASNAASDAFNFNIGTRIDACCGLKGLGWSVAQCR
jgi:hypothetical protein